MKKIILSGVSRLNILLSVIARPLSGRSNLFKIASYLFLLKNFLRKISTQKTLAMTQSRKSCLFFIFIIVFSLSLAYAEDTSQLLGQVAQIYTGTDTNQTGKIAGFSVWGLVGGFIFSSIGFVAFMYGKKNSYFKPLIIGIALMAYTFFIRSTVALYLIGICLTAALYFWRD